jgi:hypothetical protein
VGMQGSAGGGGGGGGISDRLECGGSTSAERRGWAADRDTKDGSAADQDTTDAPPGRAARASALEGRRRLGRRRLLSASAPTHQGGDGRDKLWHRPRRWATGPAEMEPADHVATSKLVQQPGPCGALSAPHLPHPPPTPGPSPQTWPHHGPLPHGSSSSGGERMSLGEMDAVPQANV